MKTFADYTIYCTEEQISRLVALDAPLEKVKKVPTRGELIYGVEHYGKVEMYFMPTAEQVIGWLREKNIFIDIFYDKGEIWFDVGRISDLQYFRGSNNKTYSTAILEAISLALDYLEKISKNK